jgi:hypothetical protein
MSQADDRRIAYEPPVTLKAGQIQFVEACHPPLVAGEYRIGMSQLIKDSEEARVPWNSDPYASELKFTIDAPRFTLDPAAIHSVYPPANQSGRFDNALPHVVFTRRTLPWERTLDSEPPALGKPFPPWLALLLVTDDELEICDDEGRKTGRRYEARSLPIASTQADSLLFPGSGTPPCILGPDVGQDGPAERWKSERRLYEAASCLAIDLPAALFKAIAPRERDLSYLAHVRQVDTGNKEILGVNDRGWFSLVIANRLPEADKPHRAFLVSLEGHQTRLQDAWKPEPGQSVRLAVLASWTFACGASNDFKARMDALNAEAHDHTQLRDSWLRLPHARYDDEACDPANVVNAAYARGYTAFDHVMRQGGRTVSWYRGPLVPLSYDKPRQVQEPVSCADELLRYDPETGLFDVTYAAAWQLGRLLALQNPSFALALARVRRALRAKAERTLRSRELDAQYGQPASADEPFMDERLMRLFADGLGEELQDAVPK